MGFLDDQAGVVSRAQLLSAGASAPELRRLLRRRELQPVHPGVYVNHTGPLTWQQRAWAAVLSVWPAALCRSSALTAYEGARLDLDGPIEVAVEHSRHVVAPGGVTVTRMRQLEARAQWHLSPPRLHYDEAVLDVAIEQTRPLERITVLSKAVGSRRTTADRLRQRLCTRTRVPDRAWFLRVLDDVAAGTHSVLEHQYLTRVERAHTLPRGQRQVRHVSPAAVRYRDVEVGQIVIELDGRLHHGAAHQWDRDLDRDLDSAVDGQMTVRLGWAK